MILRGLRPEWASSPRHAWQKPSTRSRAGKPGAKRLALLRELLAERLTGYKQGHYVTAAMAHGIETEPVAVDAYEATTGNLVSPAGLIDHPFIEFFAATPDRLLGPMDSLK